MRGYHIRISVQLKAGSTQPSSSPFFTPGSVFVKLPAQTPKPTARRNAIYNPRNKDYRFGPIRLDWVDFDMSEKTGYSTGKAREFGRGTSLAGNVLTGIPLTTSRTCCSHLHPQ
jgi:BRCA1-associated protein